jgi:hypothetical protein
MSGFSRNQSRPWYEKIQQEIQDNAKAYRDGLTSTFRTVDIPVGYIYYRALILPTEDTWEEQQCSIDPNSQNCFICSFNYKCNRYSKR